MEMGWEGVGWSWVSINDEEMTLLKLYIFCIVFWLRTIVSFHILPPNQKVIKTKDIREPE